MTRSNLDNNKSTQLDLSSVKLGSSRKTLSGDFTILAKGPIAYFFDPGASNRTITLPSPANREVYAVVHIGAASKLIVKEPVGNTTVVELMVSEGALLISSGLEWRFLAAAPSILLDPTEISSPLGSVSVAVVGNAVTLEVNTPAVDHDLLLHFIANKHIDHTAVVLTAGNGLSGGGDISASRTFNLDLNDLTADTPVLADTFAFYDVSGADTNKATLSALNSILDHNSLLNYVASRHIDHSAVSIAAGDGLSGGGTIDATRTINLRIANLAAEVASSADEVAFYDASGDDVNKITFANLIINLGIMTSLTGDITGVGPGATVSTLATVNANVGTFGSATKVAQLTVNAKGLVTAVAEVIITPAVGSITGLGANVATALAVAVGTDGAFVVKGGALGSPSSVGTLPAHTLGGAISGGGNQINNVIIGASTPLAGSFSTLNAGVNGGTGGSLKLFGATSGDSTIKVPAAAGTATIFQLPPNNGTAGYVLRTDGAGITTWVSPAGGGDLISTNNLSDVANASTARTNLGLAIGSNVQAYDPTLAALAAFNTNGLLTQTAADTFAGRTLTGTANQVTVTNGDGVSANPTISLASAPSFSAHKNSTDQTGVADSTFTAVTFGTELYDIGGLFASNAWVPPAGNVILSAQLSLGGTWLAGANMSISIFKNGAAYKTGVVYSSGANASIAAITAMDRANGTDSYSVQVYMDVASGTGTIFGNNANTYFMGQWVSP